MDKVQLSEWRRLTEIRTMKQLYDKSMARTGFALTLLAIIGGMALISFDIQFFSGSAPIMRRTFR